MKVLHVIRSVDLGGVELRVMTQTKWLRDADASIEHVVCALGGGRLLQEVDARPGVCRPEYVPSSEQSSPGSRMSFLGHVIGVESPAIVHAYNFGASFWSRVLPRKLPDVVVHHGGVATYTKRWGRVVESVLSHRSAATIYNSESTRAVIEGLVGVQPRSRVIHNGVVQGGPTRSSVRTDAEHCRCITVGRLTKIKNIDVQIEAIAELPAESFRLTIVGDGPERGRLEELARRLGVGGRVDFLGHVADVRSILVEHDVYLCTSYNETFSMSLCEAMDSGLFCVAGRVGGPAEILRGSGAGALVPMRKPVEASALHRLPRVVYDPENGCLREPRGLVTDDLVDAVQFAAERMKNPEAGRSNRERIRDRFSMARYVSELVTFYHELRNATSSRSD